MAAVAAGRRALTERLPFPTDTEIAVLHERLLARHAYAEEAAVERLLPVLTQMVQRRTIKQLKDRVKKRLQRILRR